MAEILKPIVPIDLDKLVIVERSVLIAWQRQISEASNLANQFADRWSNAFNMLVQAIEDEGVSPSFHLATMQRHRQEWPVLWSAIDKLMEVANND